MIQTGDGLGFLLEALFADRITRKLFRQDFEGNDALQPRISSTMRSSRVSLARYTSPMPPAPRGEITSYGPSF